MTRPPVPDPVRAAAQRIYLGATTDADAAVVREWAATRWPHGYPKDGR